MIRPSHALHLATRRVGYQYRQLRRRGVSDDVVQPLATILHELRALTFPTANDDLHTARRKAPSEAHQMMDLLAVIAARPDGQREDKLAATNTDAAGTANTARSDQLFDLFDDDNDNRSPETTRTPATAPHSYYAPLAKTTRLPDETHT